MPRYKLTIEYDGGPFRGWQRLGDGEPSVQSSIEDAVQRLCGERCDVHGAGRTDSGVHATGQVAHVDLPRAFRADVVRDALNAHLRPHPVAILAAEDAANDFHARFDATARAYLYRIVNRRADLALDVGRAWRIPRPLDVEAMAEGARRLLGRHDFTTFRDSQCQAPNPVKTLDVAAVSRVGDEIRCVFEARSFLHRQVRSMVGTLAEVGVGKLTPEDLAAALAAADRARCGPVAPSDGLYLTRVDYGAK
jgi:tRNA pseudouridine38-40 synthase